MIMKTVKIARLSCHSQASTAVCVDPRSVVVVPRRADRSLVVNHAKVADVKYTRLVDGRRYALVSRGELREQKLPMKAMAAISSCRSLDYVHPARTAVVVPASRRDLSTVKAVATVPSTRASSFQVAPARTAVVVPASRRDLSTVKAVATVTSTRASSFQVAPARTAVVVPASRSDLSTVKAVTTVPTNRASSGHVFQVVVMRVSIHCQGCAGKVKKILSKMEGVTSFSIDLDSKRVTVMGHVSPVGILESISKVKKAEFWPC